jgi:hypothetical protein
MAAYGPNGLEKWLGGYMALMPLLSSISSKGMA